MAESIEVRYNKLLAEMKEKDARIRTLETAAEVLKNAFNVQGTAQQITVAYYKREMMMREANLPIESKQRLHAAFVKSTDNAGLKEAINVERNYDNRGKVQPTARG